MTNGESFNYFDTSLLTFWIKARILNYSKRFQWFWNHIEMKLPKWRIWDSGDSNEIQNIYPLRLSPCTTLAWKEELLTKKSTGCSFRLTCFSPLEWSYSHNWTHSTLCTIVTSNVFFNTCQFYHRLFERIPPPGFSPVYPPEPGVSSVVSPTLPSIYYA